MPNEAARPHELDPLTGLYTRDAFCAAAAELIAQKPMGYYVLCNFDVDHFKIVNDQHGESVGDRVLQCIANVLLRFTDSCGGISARKFTDNFAMLVPLESNARFEDITNEVNSRLLQEGIYTQLQLSAGYYHVTDDLNTVGAMLDLALIAKHSVKGRYDVHEAMYDHTMRDRILEEQWIISEMEHALAAGQFEPWFQPQYDHATGMLIGAEVLVRWRHPEKGMMSPAVFIEVFERVGFIYELDKYIWSEVCRLLRRWLDDGRDIPPLSVNVSRYDAFRPDFIDTLIKLLEAYDIPKKLFRVEITESAFAESTEQLVAVVQRLRELDLTVEIDDFGSGYSSFNTLKDVPADVLKIDMKFLQKGHDSNRSGSILESIVRMGRWLNMSVIAEGVETLEQADFLLSVGCMNIQGYLYSKPIPYAEYDQLMLATAERIKRGSSLERRLVRDGFWSPDSIETMVFNRYAGGSCAFELWNGRIDVLRINNGYAAAFKTRLSVDELLAQGMKLLNETDQARILDAVRRALSTMEEERLEVCYDGRFEAYSHVEYLCFTISAIALSMDRCLLYARVENITAQREQDNQQRELLDNLPCGAATYEYGNGELKPIFLNRQLSHIIRYPGEQLLHQDVLQCLHEEDRDGLLAEIEAAIREQRDILYDCRCRDGRGQYVILHIMGRALAQQAGKAIIHTSIMPATQQVGSLCSALAAEKKAKLEEQESRLLLQEMIAKERRRSSFFSTLFLGAAENKYDTVFQIDLSTERISCLSHIDASFAVKPKNDNWPLLYQQLLNDVHPDDRAGVDRRLCRDALTAAADGTVIEFVYRRRLPCDCYHWFNVRFRISVNEQGTRIATGLFTDINEDMEERSRLHDMAEHDCLTDLFNRAKLESMACSEYRELESCGVMFFDLNGLKSVNDKRGHDAGDAMLRMMADSIRSITSRRVHGYRYGGDEFLVVVCNSTPEAMKELLSFWRERLDILQHAAGRVVTAAVGVAWSDSPFQLEELIRKADKAMYADKKKRLAEALASRPDNAVPQLTE